MKRKTTFVKYLSERLSGYEAFREGDYSSVELAWCAYVTEEEYQDVLAKYYISGFHKDLEKYEIYNGNWDKGLFEQVILSRFQKKNSASLI